MNPRITTTVCGLISLILGVLALFYPEFVMARVLGFAVDESFSANFVHGEVRAAYGGLFSVMGVATVLAAMDPVANRTRILFVGLLWLGACGGRLFGVFVDGSPGLWGWLSAAFELVVGGTLVAAAMGAPTARTPAATPFGSSLQQPVPPSGVPV
jgi:hypothetical protein